MVVYFSFILCIDVSSKKLCSTYLCVFLILIYFFWLFMLDVRLGILYQMDSCLRLKKDHYYCGKENQADYFPYYMSLWTLKFKLFLKKIDLSKKNVTSRTRSDRSQTFE